MNEPINTNLIDEEEYKNFFDDFVHISQLAINTSKLGDNRFVDKDYKIRYSCILFTRICTISQSIKTLCTSQHQSDFNSIFSLTRNIIDCSHMLFYLCFDDISQQERDFRYLGLVLYDLNDRKELLSLLNKGLGGISDTCLFNIIRQTYDLYRIDNLIDIFTSKIKSNLFFGKLDDDKKDQVLNGRYHFINTTPAKVDERMKIISNNCYKSLYKVLSSSVHSLPIVSENMTDGRFGCGVETDSERALITYALCYCIDYLKFSTKNIIEKIFFEFKQSFNQDELNELASILEVVKVNHRNNPDDAI